MGLSPPIRRSSPHGEPCPSQRGRSVAASDGSLSQRLRQVSRSLVARSSVGARPCACCWRLGWPWWQGRILPWCAAVCGQTASSDRASLVLGQPLNPFAQVVGLLPPLICRGIHIACALTMDAPADCLICAGRRCCSSPGTGPAMVFLIELAGARSKTDQ